jgi:Ner family transcriptional regulator
LGRIYKSSEQIKLTHLGVPILAMHAEDIKAAVRKAGSTQASIARALGVSRMAVCHVVAGNSSSARIAKRISEIAGVPVSQLWPGKYPRLEKLDLMARTRAAIAKQLDTERAAHAAKQPKRKAA